MNKNQLEDDWQDFFYYFFFILATGKKLQTVFFGWGEGGNYTTNDFNKNAYFLSQSMCNLFLSITLFIRYYDEKLEIATT